MRLHTLYRAEFLYMLKRKDKTYGLETITCIF